MSPIVEMPHNSGPNIEYAYDVSHSNARNSGLLRA